MKTLNPLKVPFGTAKFSRLRNVSFHQWEDAFEVEFEDGLSFLEPHSSIRKAGTITAGAVPTSVELEPETRSGFFVHYNNGQTAEVSRAFIREQLEILRKLRMTDVGDSLPRGMESSTSSITSER